MNIRTITLSAITILGLMFFNCSTSVNAGDSCCAASSTAIPVLDKNSDSPVKESAHAGHAHEHVEKGSARTAAAKPHDHKGESAHEKDEDEHGHKGHADSGEAADTHGHGHDHEHGHAQEARVDDPMPDANFGQKPCEHKIPTIDCDTCRYEIGVVKVGSEALPLLTFERLQTAAAAETIEVTGELAFDENRIRCITAPVSGRVASIGLRVGDAVREGQTLLVLQSPDPAQAALDLLKKRSELDLAAKKREREARLREKKIASEQEKQEAEAAWELARIECDNARRRLLLFGLSEKRVDQLSHRTSDPVIRGELTVTSPMNGRIFFRDVNIGDTISSDKELLKIADLTHLQGIAQAHEKHLAALLRVLRVRAVSAEVRVDAFPDQPFRATVMTPGPAVAVETRTLPLRLDVDNPEELLRPGLFFRARIALSEAQPQSTLSQAAVLTDEGRSFVFVRFRDGLFLKRLVQTGVAEGGRIGIIAGVHPDQEIVSNGAFLLKSDVLREKMGAGCAD